MLLFAVCAATDKNNGPPPAGLVPLVVFIAFLGIGISLGMETAFGVNPVCISTLFNLTSPLCLLSSLGS